MLIATRRKATGADHKKRSHTDAFTHRHFHIQTVLHTDTLTQPLLYTKSLTQTLYRHFCTQKLSDTDVCIHSHTDACTHCTNTAAHTLAYIHRHFRIQKLSQTLYTATILHTDALTHRGFYTLTLLHTDDSPVGRHEVTTKKPNTRTKSKPTNATQNTATQHKTAKPRRDRCQFMG